MEPEEQRIDIKDFLVKRISHYKIPVRKKKLLHKWLMGIVLKILLCYKYVCEVQRGKKYKKTIS